MTIQSSMSEGDVGMPPSSLPREGTTDTPEDVGGEVLPLTQGSKQTLRPTWPALLTSLADHPPTSKSARQLFAIASIV